MPEIYKTGVIFDFAFAVVEFMEGVSLRDLLLEDIDELDIKLIMFEIGQVLAKIAEFKFEKYGFFNNKLEVVNEIISENLMSFCFEALEHKYVKYTLLESKRYKIKDIFNSFGHLLEDVKHANLVHIDR